MIVTENFNKNIEQNNIVATVGTFDGVHLGHKKILDILKSRAKKINGKSTVLTFWPHPRYVLGKINGLELLNTIDEKIELFAKNDIDILINYKFTKEFASLSSYDFVSKILVNKLKIKGLILGYDHHFGKNREGRFEKLKECADKFGFFIEQVSALSLNKENISSTKIRNHIKTGEIEKANTFLGYKYFLQGKTIEGNKLGRKLGFPTANISVPNYKLLPDAGVYAVNVNIFNKTYQGITNIGFRPTVSDKKIKTIETHIFNFNENIYDKTLRIEFVKKIRNEKKFNNISDLKNQINKDIEFVKNNIF
jgi:riboflavin kinase/FMN adenylyltransferase